MRYKDLLDIVRELNPYHVVEIGTWNGKRAAEFMAVSNCEYTGFDLFEDATKETDKHEYNVKPHNNIIDVASRLEGLGFHNFTLVKGNTNDTLREWPKSNFDFAYIDGGHSIETIKNDFDFIYENIDEGGTIVLDDYYFPEIEGMGCNFLEDMGEVIKSTDKTDQGFVYLLKVIKNGSG